ncbi:hypothetical protein IV203_018316 [Nitzschia inconspicua]|uniref:Uncharacterized protein n=1 Tax=Nitzschia inconspicua TaxID=303405 RepID=A0A9K3M0U7_9STRA|nr:hypothetical protein IV203_018316 [Nitzschia inconspicua]
MFTTAVTSSSDARDDEHEKDGRVVLFPKDMVANAVVASSDEDEDDDEHKDEDDEDEDKEEEEWDENEGIFSSSEGDADEALFSLLKFMLRQVSKTVDLLRKDY